MAKADLITPALPDAYGSSSEASIAVGKVTKSDFSHVPNGNFTGTHNAIEAFLVSKGVPKQSYTAELIMFMERSFSGKYRKGERSHYQQIMPSATWRKGDTLSEKLTRCKDKETFKSRFDRIGTTAILKREHFDNREISSLDFRGRMYLRLKDTKRDNLSLFYRNDELVDDFIKSAIAFHQDQLRGKKYITRRALSGKAEVVEVRKPEMVCLENPKPLLYTEVDSRRHSGKNKGNSLRLVHSSPDGRNQNQPWKGVIDKETSGLGDYEKQIAIEAGILPDTDNNNGLVQHISSVNSYSGEDVFNLWHRAVSVEHPDKCISANPRGKQTGQATTFYKRFNEFFPTTSIADFFDHLAKNWSGAHKYLTKAMCWGHGGYPELPWLVMDRNCDHVLTWYREEMKSAAKEVKWKREVQERSSEQTLPPQESTKSSGVSVSHRTADRTPPTGRTIRSGAKLSLEHDIAWSVRQGRSAPGPKHALRDRMLEIALRKQLQALSSDVAASDARIEELLAMTDDEFDGCLG